MVIGKFWCISGTCEDSDSPSLHEKVVPWWSVTHVTRKRWGLRLHKRQHVPVNMPRGWRKCYEAIQRPPVLNEPLYNNIQTFILDTKTYDMLYQEFFRPMVKSFEVFGRNMLFRCSGGIGSSLWWSLLEGNKKKLVLNVFDIHFPI